MAAEMKPRCPRCSAAVVYVDSVGFVCDSWAQTWCGWMMPATGGGERRTALEKALANGVIRRVQA